MGSRTTLQAVQFSSLPKYVERKNTKVYNEWPNISIAQYRTICTLQLDLTNTKNLKKFQK